MSSSMRLLALTVVLLVAVVATNLDLPNETDRIDYHNRSYESEQLHYLVASLNLFEERIDAAARRVAAHRQRPNDFCRDDDMIESCSKRYSRLLVAFEGLKARCVKTVQEYADMSIKFTSSELIESNLPKQLNILSCV